MSTKSAYIEDSVLTNEMLCSCHLMNLSAAETVAVVAMTTRADQLSINALRVNLVPS